MTEDKIIDFDKLDWCFIHEGNGRGSKLLQAYLDGGQDVLMLPGYACMYFFPFLEKYKKNIDTNEILNNFYKYFNSIFDSRKNPGSESLDTLGKNKNNFLITNKKLFGNNFNFYLKKKEKNITEIFKAIHFAYFSANKKNFKKKIIISHVHVFKYFPKYIYNKFNEPKIIVMIDDPIAHFLRRDKNSYLRPNFNKFFYSDFIISIFYTFYQNVNLMTEGLQSLKIFGLKNVRAVMYKDLKMWLSMESNVKLDRISMNFSIEARSPFQSEKLIGSAFRELSASNFQILNKKILTQNYSELLSLPILHTKKGFLSPLGHWLRGSDNLIQERLEYLSDFLPFEKVELKKLSMSPSKGVYKDFRFLWSLLILASWHHSESR